MLITCRADDTSKRLMHIYNTREEEKMLSEHKYKHLISSIVSRPSNKRRRTEIGDICT